MRQVLPVPVTPFFFSERVDSVPDAASLQV